MKSEIAVWDPPKRFEYKTLDTPFSVKSGIFIEPEATGVRLAFIGDGELGGVQVSRRSVTKQMEKTMDRAL